VNLLEYRLASIHKNPYIGIYACANDDICFLGRGSPEVLKQDIQETLDVDVVVTTFFGTNLLSVFCAMNNRLAFVPENMKEKDVLSEYLEVITVDAPYSAVGNLIAMNNKGIVVSPYLEELSDYVKVTVAGTDIVGTNIFANDNGFLIHRDATDEEYEVIKKALGVDGKKTTVNFGDPHVRNGIIGNNHGMLIGANTTGPEMERIYDVFG